MGEAIELCGDHHKVPNLVKSLGLFISGENDPLRFKPHPSSMRSKVRSYVVLTVLKDLYLDEPGSPGNLIPLDPQLVP